MIRLALPALAVAALAVAGCTKKDDIPQDTATSAAAEAGPSNSHAGQFLTEAIAGDIGEIKLGQIAAENASTQNVRDLAQALVRDHGKSQDQARQLAGSVGAAIPPDARPDALAEAVKLQGLAGADFDKEFVSFVVNEHQQAINSYQAEAGTADPANVTAFAKQVLPVLQNHLQMAQSLETGFNSKGR